jgi:phenolic acid decarboxylase
VDKDGNVLTEELEIWYRDPVDCVRALIGDTTLDGYLTYAPIQIYNDEACESRVYEGMETGDWWWDTQVRMVHLSMIIIDY